MLLCSFRCYCCFRAVAAASYVLVYLSFVKAAVGVVQIIVIVIGAAAGSCISGGNCVFSANDDTEVEG